MKNKIILACLLVLSAPDAFAQSQVSTPEGFSIDFFEWVASLFESQSEEENQVVKSDGTIYDTAVKSDGTVYDAIVKSDGIIYD
mgnify:FL=1|jgi:hypothetical protein